MKTTFILLSCLISIATFGQDTTYYNIDGDVVKSKEFFNTYSVLYTDSIDTCIVMQRFFF